MPRLDRILKYGKILSYRKWCLGEAVGVSSTGGLAFNANGESCKNPPPTLLGGELGGSTPVPYLGIEGEAVVGSHREGVSGSYGVGPGAPEGLSLKATACHYKPVNVEVTEKKCSF